MSIRASGAERKKNVVPIANKRANQIKPLAGLLSPVAEEVWNKNARILSERGTFELEHYLLLILYCNAQHYIVEADSSSAEKAKTMMASRGLAGEGDSGGEKTNPVFAARNIAFSQLVRAGSMLGLDPLSSLRGGSSSKRDEHNEFDRF